MQVPTLTNSWTNPMDILELSAEQRQRLESWKYASSRTGIIIDLDDGLFALYLPGKRQAPLAVGSWQSLYEPFASRPPYEPPLARERKGKEALTADVAAALGLGR